MSNVVAAEEVIALSDEQPRWFWSTPWCLVILRTSACWPVFTASSTQLCLAGEAHVVSFVPLLGSLVFW